MGYVQATSFVEAFDVLDKGASVIAGGTDWYPARGEKPLPDSILDVNRLPGFRSITRNADGWRIGAAMRWTDIINAELPAAFDGLKAAAREVGSVQIQNAGTIAGNLCNASPAADGVPPLLTLNATVEIINRDIRRTVPLKDFITGVRTTVLAPGELVSAILVPDVDAAMRSAFLKVGARKYLVISIAMAAANVRLDGQRIAEARLAVGACSAVATRLPALENTLVGQSVAECASAMKPEHFAPLAPISDVRGSAAFRLETAAEICARVIRTAAHG